MTSSVSSEQAYPTLARRVYAVSADGLIILVGIITTVLIIAPLEPPPWVLFGIMAALVLFEPILVSTTKGSVGHHLFSIQVIDARSGSNVGLLRAIIRMLARGSFGIFSLFFIDTTKRYQALHDLLTRTVVVLADPTSMPPGAVRRHRSLEHTQFLYPSVWRRVIVIIVYLVLVVVVTTILSVLIVSDQCLQYENCSPSETVLVLLLQIGILAGIGTAIIAGMRGRLWGARRSGRT